MRGQGAYDHLDERYRRYAERPDDERIAWIKADRWIGFDQAEAAIVRLNALLAYPPRDRMPCLLIYGDTGMGKTKIIRKFERSHPATFCQATGVTNRPVVVAQVPSEPVERDLYRELLASLEAPSLIGGALAREKDICRSLLRTVGARMIVLDEVNGMLAGTYRQQRIFLNALRFLANDLKVPLVCAGTDLARQALLTDAQLAERFEALHLKPWKNDRVFATLLKSLTRILPLRAPSDLESDAVRDRIHALTSGVTARIFRLIETAAEEAVRSGKERLDLMSFGGPDSTTRIDDPICRAACASQGTAGECMIARHLPVAPRPYRDELLSSWLARVACRYGLTAQALVGWLADDGESPSPFRSLDDRLPAAEQVRQWSRACGVDPERLHLMSLSRRHPQRPHSWYLNRGPDWAPSALGSPPVCLACLAGDHAAGRDASLRADWMLAERCICPTHGELLYDRCVRCDPSFCVVSFARGTRMRGLQSM